MMERYSSCRPGLLRFARNDEFNRHCEERSDEAIQIWSIKAIQLESIMLRERGV
jgi:hypothetical protein